MRMGGKVGKVGARIKEMIQCNECESWMVTETQAKVVVGIESGGGRYMCDISGGTFIHVFFSQPIIVTKLTANFWEAFVIWWEKHSTCTHATWFSLSSLIFIDCATQSKPLNPWKCMWIKGIIISCLVYLLFGGVIRIKEWLTCLLHFLVSLELW